MYEESEVGIFAQLLSFVDRGDVISIEREYTLWLLSIAPELLRGGVKSIETIQPSFSELLKELYLVIVEPEREFDRMKFAKELKLFREKLLQRKESVEQGLPVTINP